MNCKCGHDRTEHRGDCFHRMDEPGNLCPCNKFEPRKRKPFARWNYNGFCATFDGYGVFTSVHKVSSGSIPKLVRALNQHRVVLRKAK
jgi:hypothetical protein